MDTHIATRPEIRIDDAEENSQGANTDRVSAFRTVDAKERLAPGAPVKEPRPKRRRNGLIITACSFVVLVAAGGVFWVSPYNHYSFADARRLATHARSMALNNIGGMRTPAPLAPAAQLARAPAPTPVPPPYRAPAPIGLAASGGDDMAEFLKLGGQAPGPISDVPTAAAQIKPEAGSSEPASVAPKPVAVATAAPMATLKPHGTDTTPLAVVSPAPAISAKPEPASDKAPPAAAAAHAVEAPPVAEPASTPATPPAPPKDPVAVIAALRPAPMTDTQQLQVLDLVTQLGTLVRDQRLEIAELKSNQQSLTQRVDSSLTDFGRRISLAEAHGAVNAAMGFNVHPSDLPNAPASNQNGNGNVVQVAARAPAIAPSAAPNVSADTRTHRYHVQAASPGLAMLSELDASGGEERQIPVSPGDSVPGWGKVISIAQRGTSWFVKTDHGLIQ
jgi:hypothetical protein